MSWQLVSFLMHIVGAGNGANATTNFGTGEGLQVLSTDGTSGHGAVITGEGFNTAAVDTTVAQALVLNVINPSSNANVETKLSGALVEII